MKICPRCNSQVDDAAPNCWNCGLDLSAAPQPGQQAPVFTAADPYDHTASFDPRDVSDNKVIAMLVYLIPVFGILIAIIGSKESPYVGFHVRQALKITVCEILNVILCVTILWCIAFPIVYLILEIVKIICFFSICSGKAKEAPIVKNLGFLK